MIFLKNPFALYVVGCTRYITLYIFPISQYQYFPLSLLTRVLLISLKSVIEAKSGREGFSSSHSIFTKLWFSKSWNIGNIKFVEVWFFKPELLPVPQDCGQMCSLGSFCLGKIKIIRKICLRFAKSNAIKVWAMARNEMCQCVIDQYLHQKDVMGLKEIDPFPPERWMLVL